MRSIAKGKQLLIVAFTLLVAISLMIAGAFKAEVANATGAEGDETYTIAVNTEDTTHQFAAYQIFQGDISGGKLVNIQWGTGVNADVLVAELSSKGVAGIESTDNATQVAEKLGAAAEGQSMDHKVAKEFADIASKHLVDAQRSVLSPGTYNEVEYNHVVSGLGAGYYVIKDIKGEGNTANVFTNSIMKVVGNVVVEPKTDEPESTKTVQEDRTLIVEQIGDGVTAYDKTADYEIGELVPFKLTGTVSSNMAGFETYKYEFVDVMSDGLTFDPDTVQITITTNDTDYTPQADAFVVTEADKTIDDETYNEVKITFDNLLNVNSTEGGLIPINDGTQVTVLYKAQLNEKAVAGVPEKNSSHLEVTKASSTGEGEPYKTPDESTFVFTYKLDNTKVDADNPETKLPGAQFYLRDGDNLDTAKYALINADGKVTGWTSDESEAGLVTSGEDGTFSITGLDGNPSVYYLQEVTAPEGYSLLSNLIKVEITATTGLDEAGQGKILTLSLNKTPVSNPEAGVVSQTIENKSGPDLPSTGGMGTVIFTVVGIGLMAVAAITFVVRRRASAQSKQE